MIRKTGETNDTKIKSFKKFSDIAKTKVRQGDAIEIGLEPLTSDDLPCNPNLPEATKSSTQVVDTTSIKPAKVVDDVEANNTQTTNEDLGPRYYGKVVQLPKGTKAAASYNYLESVKVPKSSVWYIMIEKQDNELQMLKYNYKKGVNLSHFITELKSYYITKYGNTDEIIEQINSIAVDGDKNYSMVKNIPPINIDGKKMISKLTEDLIHLLSK